jgi:hypothetical protein
VGFLQGGTAERQPSGFAGLALGCVSGCPAPCCFMARAPFVGVSIDVLQDIETCKFPLFSRSSSELIAEISCAIPVFWPFHF